MSRRTDGADPPDEHAHRRAFAKRLRALRVPRGFRTARSFAEKLGIDENRYTRYERAEVEPDIALLIRICQALAITPDELFGFEAPPPVGTGFAEGHQRPLETPGAAGTGNGAGRDVTGNGTVRGGLDGAEPLGHVAWRLAEEVVALQRGADASNGTTPPIVGLAAVTAAYRRLLADSIASIEQLTEDPALLGADPTVQARIVSLARQLALASSPPVAGLIDGAS